MNVDDDVQQYLNDIVDDNYMLTLPEINREPITQTGGMIAQRFQDLLVQTDQRLSPNDHFSLFTTMHLLIAMQIILVPIASLSAFHLTDHCLS